jgi:hypothetical protein
MRFQFNTSASGSANVSTNGSANGLLGIETMQRIVGMFGSLVSKLI